MKRNMDLVRDLLLKIEEGVSAALPQVPALEGYTEEEILYHIHLLDQAGLVDAIDASTMQGPDYLNIGMTWQGHEFLEQVRDPEVWQTTKAGAKKVGSWSISLLGEMAKAAVVAKAQSLGILI